MGSSCLKKYVFFKVIIFLKKDIRYSTDIHAPNYSDQTRGTKAAITGMSPVCLAVYTCPGASCTKTCVDFLLKLGIRQNPETVVHTNKFRCIKVCVRMDPNAFLLYIPINMELSAHAEVANSSLSTPPFWTLPSKGTRPPAAI